MQKVIIPALALLIGMALGALLMKNSCLPKKLSELKSFDDRTNLLASINAQLDFQSIYDISTNKEDSEKQPELVEKLNNEISNLILKFQQGLDFSQKNINDKFDYKEHLITLKDSEELIDYYHQIPNRRILTGNDSACGDEKGILSGWSFNAQIFDSLRKEYPNMEEVNFFVARKNEGKTNNTLSLIIVPSDANQNLLVQENYIYEYARPCPPKCKTGLIYITDGAQNRQIQMPDCVKNPFSLIKSINGN